MTVHPKHKLFYVKTGRNINGPRFVGEVIDVEEFGIQSSVPVLESSNAIASVPYGSELVEVDDRVFVNEDFANEYIAAVTGVAVEDDSAAEENDSADDDADEGDDMSGGEGEDSEEGDEEVDVDATIDHLSSLNKADLVAAASEYIEVDEAWTKAEIVNAVEARLRG